MSRLFNVSLEERYKRMVVYFLFGATFFMPLEPLCGTALLISAMILSAFHSLSVKDEVRKLSVRHWPLIGFFVWSFISIFQASNQGASLYNWIYYVGSYLCVYYLTRVYIDEFYLRKRLIYVMIASAVFVCLFGIYQYINLTNLDGMDWVDPAAFPLLRRRMFSTLLNPNLLGSYLLMILALTIPKTLLTSNKKEKIMLFGLSLLFFFCLVFTYSRGIWLSFALMFLFLASVLEKRLWWTFLLVPIVLFFYHGEIATRLWSLFNTEDTSVALRYALWDSTSYMILEHPFFGIGWGSFLDVYPGYNYFITGEHIEIYHAHNLYLHFAAEIGVIGLFFFLAIVFRHMRWAWDGIQKEVKQPIYYAIIAMILGISISSLTDHTLFSYQVSFVFWQLLGLCGEYTLQKE